MREFYIGIDPGKQGFACISGPDGLRHIPLDDELAFVQAMWDLKDEDVLACVENVHAMPSQGRSSIFTFGVGLGTVLGILKALGIPYATVAPQKWQRAVWDSTDRAPTTKRQSYNAAKRLHPGTDFRRNTRCKTYDDNKVDATLICDYAKLKNL
jgi:hypothetical protein